MEPILYKILRPIAKFIFKILYCPKIINRDYIPKEGRIILAGNHTNNFDCILLLSSTKRVIHFLAKDELFQGKKKFFFSRLGLVPVNRREKDPKAMKSSIDYLKENKVIGIFPEGTFNKTKDIVMPFKYGAVAMASKTKTKIIPFSITGKYKLFSKPTICFGKPYSVSKDLEKENKILMTKVSDLIIKNR